MLWPRLDGRESVREGTLSVRRLEIDLEFGDGERRICNRSRMEGRSLKVPDELSWEATPAWSVKRRETGRLDGWNLTAASAQRVIPAFANVEQNETRKPTLAIRVPT